MLIEAHFTHWVNMLGLRDKVKEQTLVHIFTVVTRYGCLWRHNSQTGSTYWDSYTRANWSTVVTRNGC